MGRAVKGGSWRFIYRAAATFSAIYSRSSNIQKYFFCSIYFAGAPDPALSNFPFKSMFLYKVVVVMVAVVV